MALLDFVEIAKLYVKGKTNIECLATELEATYYRAKVEAFNKAERLCADHAVIASEGRKTMALFLADEFALLARDVRKG